MIDKNRIFIIDNKRIAFFLIFAFMFFITEIGRKIYRPFIYSNDIFDYWIAAPQSATFHTRSRYKQALSVERQPYCY